MKRLASGWADHLPSHPIAALAVDATFQPLSPQLSLYLLRAIRWIGSDVRAGVVLHQEVLNRRAIVQRRVADMVRADQLVLAGLRSHGSCRAARR